MNPYANAPRLPDDPTIDARSLLLGDAPYVLEIGPGRGLFTRSLVAQWTAGRVLAFEVRKKYSALLDAKLVATSGGRSRCFAHDAGEVLPRLGPDGVFTHAAVHFPDPWWKKRHTKRLVLQDTLVTQLARLLAPGAELFIQTDVEDRALEYRARVLAEPAFEDLLPEGEWADESPFAPSRSNREVRAIEDGLPIFRMRFRRRGLVSA